VRVRTQCLASATNPGRRSSRTVTSPASGSRESQASARLRGPMSTPQNPRTRRRQKARRTKQLSAWRDKNPTPTETAVKKG
jgi:hypothetical protein